MKMWQKGLAYVAPNIGLVLLLGPVAVLGGIYAKYYGLFSMCSGIGFGIKPLNKRHGASWVWASVLLGCLCILCRGRDDSDCKNALNRSQNENCSA